MGRCIFSRTGQSSHSFRSGRAGSSRSLLVVIASERVSGAIGSPLFSFGRAPTPFVIFYIYRI
jgi:hypothetical protein